MKYPSLGRNSATIINIFLIITLIILIGYKTSQVTNPKIIKEISVPERKSNQVQSQIGNIDTNRIIDADKEPGNWLSHGRNYTENIHAYIIDVATKDRLAQQNK